MTGEGTLWVGLHRTPTTEQDVREAVDAAACLLPPTATLQAAGSQVTFRQMERRYWADISPFLEESDPDCPLMFCLCCHGGSLRQRGARGTVSPRLSTLTQALRREWDAPAHRLTRALMSVIFYGNTCQWLENDEDRDIQVTRICQQLNTALCGLAATRLEGITGTVAMRLAGTWPGSPHDLVQTASQIARHADHELVRY